MISVMKVENGKKRLVLIPDNEEDREYLKALSSNVKVDYITENQSILGTPVVGSLLITQNDK